MNGGYLDQSGEDKKIFVIILYLLLKIRTHIHITNTHNRQIKQTVLYFQVQ